MSIRSLFGVAFCYSSTLSTVKSSANGACLSWMYSTFAATSDQLTPSANDGIRKRISITHERSQRHAASLSFLWTNLSDSIKIDRRFGKI
jgi:hypothetical protein